MARILLKSGRKVLIKETFAQVMQEKKYEESQDILRLHDMGGTQFKVHRQDILDVRD